MLFGYVIIFRRRKIYIGGFLAHIFWLVGMRPSIWLQWLAEMRVVWPIAGIRTPVPARQILPVLMNGKELRETGYLHNHARMWFASIWIFTLNLPGSGGSIFYAMAARWRSGLQYIELALGCRLA